MGVCSRMDGDDVVFRSPFFFTLHVCNGKEQNGNSGAFSYALRRAPSIYASGP
jgi:hypothetical protein